MHSAIDSHVLLQIQANDFVDPLIFPLAPVGDMRGDKGGCCLYILSPLELPLSFSSSTGMPGENGLAGEMGHTGKMGPIGEKGINNGNSF